MTYPANAKRSLSLQQCMKTYTDFNSRLIIPSPACQFKTTNLKFNHYHSNNNHNNQRNSSSSFDWNIQTKSMESTLQTKIIQSKLQKILSRTLKKKYKNQTQGNINNNISNKRMKTIFFKQNYKLNKNKKQLQDLNRKTMAEGFQKSTQTLKKAVNKSNMFIIKQLKPIKIKINPLAISTDLKQQEQQQEQSSLTHYHHLSTDLTKKQKKQQLPINYKNKHSRTQTHNFQHLKLQNIKHKHKAMFGNKHQVIQIYDEIQQIKQQDKDKDKGQQNRYKDNHINNYNNIEQGIIFNTRKTKLKQRFANKMNQQDIFQPWGLDQSNHSAEGFQIMQ